MVKRCVPLPAHVRFRSASVLSFVRVAIVPPAIVGTAKAQPEFPPQNPPCSDCALAVPCAVVKRCVPLPAHVRFRSASVLSFVRVAIVPPAIVGTAKAQPEFPPQNPPCSDCALAVPCAVVKRCVPLPAHVRFRSASVLSFVRVAIVPPAIVGTAKAQPEFPPQNPPCSDCALAVPCAVVKR